MSGCLWYPELGLTGFPSQLWGPVSDPLSLHSIIQGSPAGADVQREMRNLTRLAQNGFVDAKLFLGQILRTGTACVPADQAACLTWLKQALDSGRSAARLELERLCGE